MRKRPDDDRYFLPPLSFLLPHIQWSSSGVLEAVFGTKKCRSTRFMFSLVQAYLESTQEQSNTIGRLNLGYNEDLCT